ncbi:MAG: hypothetical protein WCG25_03630 [bacterium]
MLYFILTFFIISQLLSFALFIASILDACSQVLFCITALYTIYFILSCISFCTKNSFEGSVSKAFIFGFFILSNLTSISCKNISKLSLSNGNNLNLKGTCNIVVLK